MTAPCIVCDSARENYRVAVIHATAVEDSLRGIDDMARMQVADDHVWLCLDELNHAEAQHALGNHSDVAQERVA